MPIDIVTQHTSIPVKIGVGKMKNEDDLVTFLDKITEYAINSLSNVFN